ETSEEAPPVTLVGRFLRNYGSQGILERAAALLLARPMRYSAEQHWRLQEEALRVLAAFGRRDMPVVAHLDLGRTSPQTVRPSGCRAEVDAVGRRVVLLEPGVAEEAPRAVKTPRPGRGRPGRGRRVVTQGQRKSGFGVACVDAGSTGSCSACDGISPSSVP